MRLKLQDLYELDADAFGRGLAVPAGLARVRGMQPITHVDLAYHDEGLLLVMAANGSESGPGRRALNRSKDGARRTISCRRWLTKNLPGLAGKLRVLSWEDTLRVKGRSVLVAAVVPEEMRP